MIWAFTTKVETAAENTLWLGREGVVDGPDLGYLGNIEVGTVGPENWNTPRFSFADAVLQSL